MSPATPPERRVLLVRHAHAGDRTTWRGDDSLRPLSDKGWRQAEGIAAQLAGERVDRVVSSPSLRCVQTLEPLARANGVRVEEDERLLEGADPAEALELLESADGTWAACSHGDVIPGVLELLGSAGARIGGQMTWPKASTWLLEGDDGAGRFARASYLPPP